MVLLGPDWELPAVHLILPNLRVIQYAVRPTARRSSYEYYQEASNVNATESAVGHHLYSWPFVRFRIYDIPGMKLTTESTTIISIIRLTYTSDSLAALDSDTIGNWLFVQVTSAVVCVSMPTYGRLFSKGFAGPRIRAWCASLACRSLRSSGLRHHEAHNHPERLHNRDGEPMARVYIARVTRAGRPVEGISREFPLELIVVNKTSDVA